MKSPTKRVESWTIRNDGRDAHLKTPFITVVKIAVRHPNGTFHGATNFGQRTSY